MNSLVLASLSLPNLVSRLPGGVAQGIIWGIMALGVYITFRLLDVADLTVDGSFTTGGAVTVMLIIAGWPAWAALLAAVVAGLLAGLVTGLLHTKLGIPAILAGILTQFALYSINLRIMSMKANTPVNPDKYSLFLTLRSVPGAIWKGLLLAAVLIALLYWYFGTEQGSAIRATGANPAMSRAQGININAMKVLGLSLSNGMVALSGGLMAQYQGFADINMGRGAIVIGQVLCDAFFRKGCNFSVRLSFVILGGIVYYLVMVLILWLKLDPNDLKLFTAVIVAAFLAVPYLKGQAKSSFHRLKKGDK
jgi:putative ABC transport system permease protein